MIPIQSKVHGGRPPVWQPPRHLLGTHTDARPRRRADRFDVVFCESVLAFVEDKARAIRECVRVTRPGGYVGLNETYWIKEPSPEMVAQVRASVGTAIPTAAVWQSLWEESGLQDRVVRLHEIEARAEIRDRLRWVGRKWALQAFGRLFRLYLTNPAARQFLRETFGGPSLETMHQMGYGLFVGNKQGRG